MRERFIKKIEELDRPSEEEKALQKEIFDLQENISTITNALREVPTDSSKAYRDKVVLENEIKADKEKMKDNGIKIAESVKKRENSKKKINEIIKLQDKLDLAAINLEDSLDNLQYEQGLLSNEKNDLKAESKSLANEEKKIDNNLKKVETKKAILEAKKDEIELREVKLDKELVDFKKKLNTVLETRMKNIAQKREKINDELKAAKTDEEKEKIQNKLQKNLKENDENNDVFITVNHLDGIDLLTIPELKKHLSPKLKEIFENCKDQVAKLGKERTKFENDFDKIENEQQELTTRRTEISTRKDEISARNVEIADLENEVNGEYKEVKNKYNSLRNRSSRCDLAISRILKGYEWDDIHVDLNKFKNRDFSSKENRLSERYVEEEYYILDNEVNELEDIQEPVEEVIEEQEPEVIVEDQVIEDNKPEEEQEEISDEEIDDISNKLNEQAEKDKLEAEINNRSQISNPNYFFDSLKNDLQNDINSEIKEEQEKASKNNLPVPAEEKKPGIFARIKNWFKSKFSRKQEEDIKEIQIEEPREEEQTAVVPIISEKAIEEETNGIDLTTLNDKEFEQLMKETTEYNFETAEKNVDERNAEKIRKAEELEAKKQKEATEYVDKLLEEAEKLTKERKEKLIEKREQLSKEALFREGKKFGNAYANNSANLRKQLDDKNSSRINNNDIER